MAQDTQNATTQPRTLGTPKPIRFWDDVEKEIKQLAAENDRDFTYVTRELLDKGLAAVRGN